LGVILREEEKESRYREEWANAVAIRFKRPQYEKLLELKGLTGCQTWEELADVIYRMRESLRKARHVYKV